MADDSNYDNIKRPEGLSQIIGSATSSSGQQKGQDVGTAFSGVIIEQMHLHGLGGRSWNRIELFVTSVLNRLWFAMVPELLPVSVAA